MYQQGLAVPWLLQYVAAASRIFCLIDHDDDDHDDDDHDDDDHDNNNNKYNTDSVGKDKVV